MFKYGGRFILGKSLYFDKNNTFLVKGIGIIFMVLHHCVGLYYNQFDLSWYSLNSSNVDSLIILFFSTAGKVCVPILTIVSGFGITKSYSRFTEKSITRCKNIKFCLSHLIQFYSIYWIIFILTAPLTYINIFEHYFNNHSLYKGIIFFGVDFLGIQPRLSWYIRAIIVLYLLFPLLYQFVKRLKLFAVILSFVPWILKLLINNVEINIDSVIFCILPFVTGIYFAMFDSLDNLKRKKSIKFQIFSFIFVVIFFALRLLFSIYVDYFFSLSLICFGTLVLSDIKGLNSILILFGKHSANIWLIHCTMLSLFPLVALPQIMKFLVILLAALFISILIEYVKKITGYSMKIKDIRCFVER